MAHETLEARLRDIEVRLSRLEAAPDDPPKPKHDPKPETLAKGKKG